MEGWNTDFTAWASIEPLRGRELWYAHQVRQDVTHRILMRWREGVTPDHRIRHNFRNFNVTSAINVGEESKTLQIMAIEDVS